MPTDVRTDEPPSRRSGDNRYPVRFSQRFGGIEMHLDVPEGVWNPTPHGLHLGNVLADMDLSDKYMLELGTGCGIHAIVLARRGASRLLLTEINPAVSANALHNLRENDVSTENVRTVVADWTSLAPDVLGHPRPDMLVTNPPFAKSGKTYRRYFIDTLILDAHKLVRPAGEIVFVQSSMADVPRSIALMEECGMTVRIAGETDGPFRDYYFEDPQYLKEMAAIPGAYDVRDGVHFERLVVFRARLPG